ncbi:MAG: hypothetical protein AAB525_04460 [Patescibacteria group bacterium]
MPEKLSRREFIKRTMTAGCGLGFLGCAKLAPEKWETNIIEQLDSNVRENIENKFDEKWFREYQQFEGLLRKNNIKEKLEWLQRKYKKNLFFFEIAASINFAIDRSQIITDEIQRLVQNEKNWDQEDKQASVENINQQGLELLADIKAHWLFSFTDKKQELMQSEILFKGFEDSGIDLQKLEAILNLTYPQDILSSHIAEINWFNWQKSQEIKFQRWKNLEFPGRDKEDLDLIQGLVNRPAGKIRTIEIENFAWRKKEVHIYSVAKFPLAPQKALQYAIGVLHHEVFGHATDWAHSSLLNNFQRIDFFIKSPKD